MIRLLERMGFRQPPVSLKEKFLAGVLAFTVLFGVSFVHQMNAMPDQPLLMASMGATAVLLFATPHSTLVQPWSIIGGHVVSASIGVAALQWIPAPFTAAAAVGLSILAMHLLHCLHPPGGATSLFAVIGGPGIWGLGYGYVLNPVALDAGLMLLFGLLIHNILRPSAPYPAPVSIAAVIPEETLPPTLITPADIRESLEESGHYLDITDDDLWQVYQRADLKAHQRLLSTHPISKLDLDSAETLASGDRIDALWHALERSRNGCVVIVDAFGKVEGMVTRTDVIRFLSRKKRSGFLITGIPGFRASIREDASVSGDIMSSPVTTIPESATLDEVATILAQGRFHHVPVVDQHGGLRGLITHAHVWQWLSKCST